jgi:hypothetical protein|tara:strand:+ start:76 stop:312 length:237 start_codon:yes stop_codon:yes gene_type:complete
MKEVKFTIVLEVHDLLDKLELADMLKKYIINDHVAGSMVQKVIGENDSPEHFSISSMELEEQKVSSKRKTKKKVKTKK